MINHLNFLTNYLTMAIRYLLASYIMKAIQKVKNVCAYSPRTYLVAADHWFVVFSVMLKSCLMYLYIGPCHVVSAEIAVAMAVAIENPANYEMRGVIRFLQAD